MKVDRSSRTLGGVGLGGLGSLFVAAGLVGIRDVIDNANVALILVLVVLVAVALSHSLGLALAPC